MGLFPLVQSPCPYKGPLSDILDGSMCRLCKREVHDIGAMGEAERIALVSGCADEICVTYKVPAHSAIAAMALGAAALASPAMAQEQVQMAGNAAATILPAPATEAVEAYDDMAIIVGGIRKPNIARWHSDKPAAKGRELPVIVEQQAEAKDQSLSEPAKRT